MRGDLTPVDYEPARGSEADRARPAVIVCYDCADAAVARTGRGVITLVPLTTNTARVHPFQVLLPAQECGLPKDCKVRCEQVRALTPERLLRPIGSVPRRRMTGIDVALRRHLAL